MGFVEQIARYSYRLRPGKQAELALLAEWGRCRWVWNESVHQQRTGRKPTLCKLGKLLTAARAEMSWLRDGASTTQHQVVRSYSQALGQSFTVKGRGRPQTKNRKTTLPSIRYKKGFRIVDGRLWLAKLPVGIPVVWSRELPSHPKTVVVHRDSLGDWYASFVVRREGEPLPVTSGAIGIDWGVKVTATTTDPEYDLPFGGHRKASADELAKWQRRMARRRAPKGKPASKGYKRAKLAAAKVAKKGKRQTQHTSRVWAKRVVDNHGLIALEDFKPKFLAKSTMARKAADAAIGQAKRELIERGRRAGREVVLVPPAYTTMTCSACGTRTKERLGLGQRVFRCEACGFTADRDLNAARTILATVDRDRAGADDVRRLADALRDGSEAQSEPGRLATSVASHQ